MKYVYFVRGKVHAALAEVSIRSVLRADARAFPVVYTDEDSVALGEAVNDLARVVQFDSRGAPMMIANLDAQCRAIAAARGETELLFLDTDTLLLGYFPPLITEDVLVTWRDRIGDTDDGAPIVGIAASMPYNYGVIGVRAGYPALQAFIWMRERIRTMSPTLQRWYGNQVALAALCGARPQSGSALDKRRIPWTLTEQGDEFWVRKLECSRFNYTPQKPGEVLDDRLLLHFKGKKRHLMQGYAEDLNLPWPEVLTPKPEVA